MLDEVWMMKLVLFVLGCRHQFADLLRQSARSTVQRYSTPGGMTRRCVSFGIRDSIPHRHTASRAEPRGMANLSCCDVVHPAHAMLREWH